MVPNTGLERICLEVTCLFVKQTTPKNEVNSLFFLEIRRPKFEKVRPQFYANFLHLVEKKFS